jgi:hypothetical protein
LDTDNIVLGRRVELNPIDKDIHPITFHYSFDLFARKLLVYLLHLQQGQPNMKYVTFNYQEAADFFRLPTAAARQRVETKQKFADALTQLSYQVYPSHEDLLEQLPLHRLRHIIAMAYVTQEAKKVLTTHARKLLTDKVLIEVSPYLGRLHPMTVPHGLMLETRDIFFQMGYRLLVHAQINNEFKMGYDSIVATRSYNKFFNRVIGIKALFDSIGMDEIASSQQKECFLEALHCLKPFFQFAVCHAISADTYQYVLSGISYDGVKPRGTIDRLVHSIPAEKLLKYKLFYNVVLDS